MFSYNADRKHHSVVSSQEVIYVRSHQRLIQLLHPTFVLVKSRHLTPVRDHRGFILWFVVLSSKTSIQVVKKRREAVGVERIFVRGLERSAPDFLRNISRSGAHVQLVFRTLESLHLAPTLGV